MEYLDIAAKRADRKALELRSRPEGIFVSARFKYTQLEMIELVNAVQRGTYCLPDLQRPYVWDDKKACKLLDSMYRGYPVGSVLLWGTGQAPSHRIGREPEANPTHLIVDGQQRLTTLYAVISGAEVLRNGDRWQRIRVAFNPLADEEQNESWFEPISNETRVRRGLLYPVTDFFAPTTDVTDQQWWEVAEDWIKEHDDLLSGDEARKQAMNQFNRLSSLLRYPFSPIELSAEMSLEEVAEIFARTNNDGVKLSLADFVLTLMSVYWESGRKDLEAFLGALTDVEKRHFTPEPGDLLRVSGALGFRFAKLRDLQRILQGLDDEGRPVTIDDRSATLERLGRAQSRVLNKQNWSDFAHCIDSSGFVSSGLIAGSNYINVAYSLWLIGLYDYNVPRDTLAPLIARWFFMSNATERYGKAAESKFQEDLNLIAGVTLGDAQSFCEALDKFINTNMQAFWATLPLAIEQASMTSTTAKVYLASQVLLKSEPLLGVGQLSMLFQNRGDGARGIERHHLFPSKYLKESKGITEARLRNRLANMAVLSWVDNIKITDRPPNEYWPDQVAAKQSSSGLTQARLDEQCRAHGLPEGWWDMSYDEMIAARVPLMVRVIQSGYGSLAE